MELHTTGAKLHGTRSYTYNVVLRTSRSVVWQWATSDRLAADLVRPIFGLTCGLTCGLTWSAEIAKIKSLAVYFPELSRLRPSS